MAADAEKKPDADAAADAPRSTALTRGIACLVHFKDHHDEAMHLTLKITVNPKWFGRHVREALIGPFVDAYNKKKGKDKYDRPIDPFMMRCCAVDGARIEGNEKVGRVILHLSKKRADKIAELFVAGVHYTSGKWWREEVTPLLEGKPLDPALKDAPENPALFGSGGEIVASPPMPRGLSEETGLIAKDRYAPPPPCTNAALATLGDRVHELLKTPEAPYLEVRAAATRWLNTVDSVANALACVDDKGRTLLHNAVSRGDSRLCAQLAAIGDGAMVLALDAEYTTPIMEAAIAGRTLVLKEILKAPCVRPQHLNERNYYCMSALQLCCCDDAQGSPSTAELLVRHGADVNARCWDKTPLMAAAASEHYELVQALCEELGADPMLRNGEMMMAMDYCKTIHTSELLHGFMDGHFLMNKAAPSFVSEDDGKPAHDRFRDGPLPGDDPFEEHGPRYFAWTKEVPLADAFSTLEVDGALLGEFDRRRVALRRHDRVPVARDQQHAARRVDGGGAVLGDDVVDGEARDVDEARADDADQRIRGDVRGAVDERRERRFPVRVRLGPRGVLRQIIDELDERREGRV